MCQFTAPPAVFLAGPLQAPLSWLFSAGFLAATVIGVPYTYRKYLRERLRQHPSALYRRVGLALVGSAVLALCTSEVLLDLVITPSSDALGAWAASQRVALDASHCALRAYIALGERYDRQNGTISTLDNVVFVLLFVGLGAAVIWLLWVYRRPRAHPAQQ